MRVTIAIVTAALFQALSSPASAQGRPLAQALYTPPLGNVDSFVDNTFEAGFVNNGTAQLRLTIQLCTLAGVCTSPGFACINVLLTRGQGCATGNIVDNQPLYAKFLVTRAGQGILDGLGSLRVIGPDGTNSAAVQTIRSGLEEQPATEN